MNIVRSFANYLATQQSLTYGHDLFLSRARASGSPDSDDGVVPESIWWLKTGGSQGRRGKLFVNPIEIYYRDRNAEVLYDKLAQLGEDLSCTGCVSLEGFTVTEVEVAGLFADQDLDSEDRTVGLLQINVITFKRGC